MATKTLKHGKVRYFARVMKNGQVRTQLFKTQKEALEWEADQRKSDWSRTGIDSLSLHEWATEYLDYSKVQHTPKTFIEKRACFKSLFKHIDPQTPIRALIAKKLLSYLQTQAKERSGYAANKDRKNLGAAWNWGITYLNFPSSNPLKKIKKFPEVRTPRYIPPEEDFWAVYDAAKSQDQVMLSVAIYTAARRGEIFRLTWEDIDFPNEQICLTTKKRRDGSESRTWLPMLEELRDSIRWWWEHRTYKDIPYLFACEDDMEVNEQHLGQPFTDRRKMLKILCEKAKVKYFGWHAIRHLTATILFHSGYSVAEIQPILRHKSPNTTERYLRSLGLANVKPALSALSRSRERTRKKADVIQFQKKDESK